MKNILSILLVLLIFMVSADAVAQSQCKATTKKGTQCSRQAKRDGLCTQHWKMKNMSAAERCQATTRAGKQCSRKKSTGSNYCWQHGGTTKSGSTASRQTPSTSGQCQATTKKGTQCKHRAANGSKFCNQHMQ